MDRLTAQYSDYLVLIKKNLLLHGEDSDEDDTVGGEGEDGDGGEHHDLLPLQRL